MKILSGNQVKNRSAARFSQAGPFIEQKMKDINIEIREAP